MTQRDLARPARNATRRSADDERVPELELLRRDPRTAAEIDAARLEYRVASMLTRAAHARSDMTHKELADILGVTEGRVSQVLSSEGPPRLSTLARYMSALGYLVEVRAEPTSESVPDIDGLPETHFPRWFVNKGSVNARFAKRRTVREIDWLDESTQPMPVVVVRSNHVEG